MWKGRDRTGEQEADTRPAGRRSWFRLPGRTIRVRLTLAYWILFIISGAAMLVLTVALWHGTTGTHTAHATATHAAQSLPEAISGTHSIGVSQHSSDAHGLLIAAGAALAIMAIPAIALGWLVAGRYLRPLRTITGTARDISATNLHQRLNLAGPADELKELGDTFDNLLARLERSFQSERRFIANASHELRTPLATMRASLDVAMAKPGPFPPQTITLTERLRHELDHIDRLLDSFLTLAHTQQAPEGEQTTVSLQAITAASIERRSPAISSMGLNIDVESNGPAGWITGSETLLSQMVDNVIDNAVKHNQPGGWIRVRATIEGPNVRLVVDNGGPLLDQNDTRELARPFRRLGTERTGSEKGSGLGLSIVEAIAESHGGELQLEARSEGGLRVTLTLPLAAAPVAGARR